MRGTLKLEDVISCLIERGILLSEEDSVNEHHRYCGCEHCHHIDAHNALLADLKALPEAKSVQECVKEFQSSGENKC